MGIGINANHDEDDFPSDLRDKASSLKIVAHREIDRIRLVKSILVNLEEHYHEYLASGFKRLIKPIKNFSSVLGKEVAFKQNGESCVGKAVDIDAQGQLVVLIAGKTVAISSGEISLAENY